MQPGRDIMTGFGGCATRTNLASGSASCDCASSPPSRWDDCGHGVGRNSENDDGNVGDYIPVLAWLQGNEDEFDLDLSMLEPGYTYGIKYSFYEDSVSSYREQPYLFKIRVEKNES